MHTVRATREHRPLFETFTSGAPALDEYLKRFALRHDERDRLSRTWLAVDGLPPLLVGFYSLAVVSVDRESVANLESTRGLPRFPIPAVLLARFAVDVRAQGQGVGRYLFEEALDAVLQLSTAGPAAVRLFVADAKDEAALRFYVRRGMTPITDDGWPRRVVIDLACVQVR